MTNSFTQRLPYLVLVLTFTAFTVLPAAAHESRELPGAGDYTILFGWNVEPAFVNQPNGAFFQAGVADPPGQPDLMLLDRTAGDTVQVTAIPFRLDTDNINSANIHEVLAHTVEVLPPLFNFAQCDETSGCEELGYVKAITPHHTGAYGFFFVGKLKRHNHDGFVFPKKFLAETFVCERGSQDTGPRDPTTGLPDNGNFFDCVEE